MNDRSTTTIIIIGGGGAIASSTALHLLRSGYTPSNITVLDTDPIQPAPSAENDVKRIVGVRLHNKVDLQLSLEARQMWTEDELFMDYFHKAIRLDCAYGEKGLEALKQQFQALLNTNAGLDATNEWLDSEDEILEKLPLLKCENIKGWKAICSKDGGWFAAARAVDAVVKYIRDRGVNLQFGGTGAFKQPLFEGERCVGVETVDSTRYYADKIVLTTKAGSHVLADLQDQCVSKAWVHTHLQLTPEQAVGRASTPVVHNGMVRFFFEPYQNGVIRIWDMLPGFTLLKQHQPMGTSVLEHAPVSRSQAGDLSDPYSIASRQSTDRSVHTFLPVFTKAESFNRSICWCIDPGDADLLMCEYPGWQNLFVAIGDHNHSLKFLPNIGKHVVNLLEGTLPKDLTHGWRWRPRLAMN